MFGEMADRHIVAMESARRNAKHHAQWRATFTSYAAPLRPIPVAKIGGRDKPLSNMAFAMLLHRLGIDVTAHGFRSSFKDWVGEETIYLREIAEAALAHLVGDKTEQAYRRGDALAKRREMTVAWTDFCSGTMISA